MRHSEAITGEVDFPRHSAILCGTVAVGSEGMSLFSELRRRNIFRVALLYVVLGWLLLDIGAVVVEQFGIPDWTWRFAFALLVICFPLALVFSWIYEITPEGLKRERAVEREHSITRETGRRLMRAVYAGLVLIAVINLARMFAT